MPLLFLMDLLGQVHQLGQLDQQVLSLHQLRSQGKPLNQPNTLSLLRFSSRPLVNRSYIHCLLHMILNRLHHIHL